MTVEEEQEEQAKRSAATVALVDLAGRAVKASEKHDDPRLKKIADLCLKQVSESNGLVPEMLKLLTAEREREPEPKESQFIKTLNENRAKAEEGREQLQDLVIQLLTERTQNG